ncbi:MAG TPA: ABC transporter ATP-binding protein [Solirubrobacteraceae bacterium]|nr:ABC transporter ATP-binding protein [Solirubrobacteraceae bacterium]
MSIGLRAEPQPLERAGLPDAVAVSGASRVYPARDGGGGIGAHPSGAHRSEAHPSASGGVPALADVSLRAGPGELVAVVGPSGCGKTTLLELICGLQRPDAGSVRSAPAALMPQHDLLLPWLSAVDNAALALRIARQPRAQARGRAQEMFAELGLGGFEAARPYELSGGMRQRVAFVRTLLSGKPVLCLDEPFGALDAITRAEMQGWLARALQREPRTVVLVTHDVEEAVLLADRVVVLSPRPGRTVAELEIGLPRPRARTDAAVTALREQALIALGMTENEGPGWLGHPHAENEGPGRLGHPLGSA